MIALQHNIPVGVEVINKGTEINVSSRDVVEHDGQVRTEGITVDVTHTIGVDTQHPCIIGIAHGIDNNKGMSYNTGAISSW